MVGWLSGPRFWMHCSLISCRRISMKKKWTEKKWSVLGTPRWEKKWSPEIEKLIGKAPPFLGSLDYIYIYMYVLGFVSGVFFWILSTTVGSFITIKSQWGRKFFLGDRFNFSFRKHFFFHLPPFWKMISPMPPSSENDWKPQVLGGSSQFVSSYELNSHL